MNSDIVFEEQHGSRQSRELIVANTTVCEGDYSHNRNVALLIPTTVAAEFYRHCAKPSSSTPAKCQQAKLQTAFISDVSF